MHDQQYLEHLRHSCAHLLAAAVMELWPTTKRTIGPAIENGFYYDFEFDHPVSENDFPKIEEKMRELAKSWKGFERQDVSASEAKDAYKDNPYKVELIEEFSKEGQKLTFYKSGAYSDLCRGGHVEHPDQELQDFKLLKIAGAYWRGDEKNKMLTRIYGTIFPSKQELDTYLQQQEEAKKRDHRKLGKELDLFTFSPLVGSGLPLYTQRGALIRRLLNEFVEEMQVEEGYQQVWTPQIAKAELFKTSGHYDKYKADMFRVVSNYSDEEMFLKPMNCPQHSQIYASKPRSYRDLPIRMTDFAMLYRDERPGELNGLARVRSFSQDDCHIFCREDQVDEEIDRALSMTKTIMDTFGFKYRYRLSTRDPKHHEKYLGNPKIWDKVEGWAEEIMKRNKIEYYDGPGEAAFYAPKMDLMATDALGREWQLSTVQIDYVQPARFNLTYIGNDGQEKQPVMIHRAIIGSAERMMMILLEHFAGALPLWLSPVQVAIIPISQDQNDYAEKTLSELKAAGIRAENWNEAESMQNRIRHAEQQKIPYMLVVGKREAEQQQVAVRMHGNKQGGAMSIEPFIQTVREKTKVRALEL
ncbi:MAG TPA: threonine--tRNA ligase [Patescibacteria group bacterium]|nr:threonine--tRNA ligase [Patescibacteria group bacterium]